MSSGIVFRLDVFSKIIRGPSGMDGSEMTTGTPHDHPQASAVKRDRFGAGVALTKLEGSKIWYGTISIGTPPKSFTGKFYFRVFVHTLTLVATSVQLSTGSR
jgi:hypothetical protein